jgi:hypothetical protein
MVGTQTGPTLEIETWASLVEEQNLLLEALIEKSGIHSFENPFGIPIENP